MKQVHTETGREQWGYGPQLPPRYGIEETPEMSDEGSIKLGKVRKWTAKPPNGPEGSNIGVFIVVGILIVWTVWVVLGFIWLFRTGDLTLLKTSPIALIPLGLAVVKYYTMGKRQKANPLLQRQSHLAAHEEQQPEV